MPSTTGFITVGQAAAMLDVTRQRIHQLMKDKQIVGVIWMLERWAIPEAEVDRLAKERKKSTNNGNGKKKAA